MKLTMKSFTDLDIPLSITTTSGDPIKDFFIPVMSCATQYDIAVGYFSSYWIRDAAEGIYTLVRNGGTSRWVINPDIADEDIEMLESTSNDTERLKRLDKIISASFAGLLDNLENDTRDTIAWLIHKNILRFRIAYPKNKLSNGIFHPKFGILTDSYNNRVTFTGSYNKTGRAQCNWETIEIFKSWEDERRCASKESEFNQIWSGGDKNLSVFGPTQGILRRARQIVRTGNIDEKMEEEFSIMSEEKMAPEFPFPNGPMRYQLDAYYSWVENGRTGILAMATGTGKTITALNCLLKDYDKTNSYKTIIVVPSKYLAGQWEAEVRKFKFYENIIRFDSTNTKKRFEIENLNTLLLLEDHNATNFVIITTYASFSRLVQLFKTIPEETVLIADEAHRIGAENTSIEFEKTKISRKIGLSATPQRFFSTVETQRIENIFNDRSPYIASYTLSSAIKDGRLAIYSYYPKVVFLNEVEREKYNDLSKKIIKFNGNNNEPGQSGDGSVLEALLRLRKQIVDKCQNKISAFTLVAQNHIEVHGNLRYCIAYTAKGNSEDDQSIVDTVCNEMSAVLPNISIAQYTSTAEFSSDEELGNKMRAFVNGDIQTLVAMKMLDEGVDIPRAEVGILGTSSRDPREFIQRLGRLLRKHPDKQLAYIYDLFVLPGVYPDSQHEINLFEHELRRIVAVAQACNNKMEVRAAMEEYMDNFGLYWDIVEEELTNG